MDGRPFPGGRLWLIFISIRGRRGEPACFFWMSKSWTRSRVANAAGHTSSSAFACRVPSAVQASRFVGWPGTMGRRSHGNPGLGKFSPAACGRSRREEKAERRGFGRGPLARLVPNLEYGVVRRLPMRREVARWGADGLPHGAAWGGAARDEAGPRRGWTRGTSYCGWASSGRTNREVRPHRAPLSPSPRPPPAVTRVLVTGCRFAGGSARAAGPRASR